MRGVDNQIIKKTTRAWNIREERRERKRDREAVRSRGGEGEKNKRN